MLCSPAQVAVRANYDNPHWHRGKLTEIAFTEERGAIARVFLIDYGTFLEGVLVRVNVRSMPRNVRVIKPLAFQLVASGGTS